MSLSFMRTQMFREPPIEDQENLWIWIYNLGYNEVECAQVGWLLRTVRYCGLTKE